jgi:hypothetical protein
LAVDDANARQWVGDQGINVVSRTIVPTIRLDTFMNLAGIQTVDYLKIDPQGADLSVVKSPGDRVRDLRKIYLELSVTPFPDYHGAANKGEVIEYLAARGFKLAAVESQSNGQEENLTFENRAANA